MVSPTTLFKLLCSGVLCRERRAVVFTRGPSSASLAAGQVSSCAVFEAATEMKVLVVRVHVLDQARACHICEYVCVDLSTVSLSIYLSVYLSVYYLICLAVYLSLYTYIYIYIHICIERERDTSTSCHCVCTICIHGDLILTPLLRCKIAVHLFMFLKRRRLFFFH